MHFVKLALWAFLSLPATAMPAEAVTEVAQDVQVPADWIDRDRIRHDRERLNRDRY